MSTAEQCVRSQAARQESALESLELELLLDAVARRYGYDFRDYAPASLRRRVDQARRLEGVRSLSALQDCILHDPDALTRFVTTMSVQVTSLFRDPHVYRYLRRSVMPVLRTFPFVRVWHAGCATGEEVYSMAILLREEGLLDRSRIYATDLSDAVLERARRGVYGLEHIREQTSAYQATGATGKLSDHYVADDRNAIFSKDLRRRIVFSRHDLVSDGPFNEFHLIFCRNVLIYFAPALQDRVCHLLHRSLVRPGLLVLGLRESLQFTGVARHFQPMDKELRIYRRQR